MNGSFPTFPSVAFAFPPVPAQRCQRLRQQGREPEGGPCRAAGSSVSALRKSRGLLQCLGDCYTEQTSQYTEEDECQWESGSSLSEGTYKRERGRPRKNSEVLD